ALAGAAAATGVAVAMADAQAPAATPSDASGEQASALQQLHEWLQSQGADVSKVQAKPSQAGPGAGLGLFATAPASAPRPGTPWWSWLWPRRGAPALPEPVTLASFPLAAAITLRTACSDPQLGEQFSWMVDKQLLDERTAVMVYLLIEKLRGDKSRFAPWIRTLPRSFDVPITFAPTDLAELRGTALQGAAAAVTRRLRDTWSRLEAPLRNLTRELGLPAPTWEDWLWAYCVFWSRGQSLPVPESGSASSALIGHSSGNGSDKIPIQILEGLVPGLDFCNHRHSPQPQCWWEVVVPERPKTAAPTCPVKDGPMVRLQLHAGGTARAGDELYISYGDKSNEELLMLYGFALEKNPHDHLMLFCPLPPQAEWDDVMYARIELLQAYGLRPQFFLPHPDQVAAPAAGKPVKGAAAAGKKKGSSAAAPSPAAAVGEGGAAAADDTTPPLVLPGEVLDTLEVFVLNFQELSVRSKTLQAKMEERRAARAAGTPLEAVTQHSPVLDLASLRSRYPGMGLAELRHSLQSMGLRMATITTFIRLLELKVVDLEGSEGTGSLEADEELLRSLDQATSAPLLAAPSGAPAAAATQQREEQQQRQRRLRAALVYRMGQKQLARAWLVRAKAELRGLMAVMREMQARQEALERAGQQ
ncbi:hypothetical protein Agub_g8847, partial [Astrephomene gubernaculifera]